jgi:hypothetical protein
MNRAVVRDTVLSGGLWLLPMLLLFAYGPFWREAIVPEEPDPEPGYPWLALPAAINGRLPRFEAWHGLDVPVSPGAAREDESVHRPEVTTLPERPPIANSFRIRLAGRIRDENEDLYCFFDTGEDRWFRMSEGAVDLRAGVRLEVDSRNGRPVLTNLADGTVYVAKAGEVTFEKVIQGEMPETGRSE